MVIGREGPAEGRSASSSVNFLRDGMAAEEGHERWPVKEMALWVPCEAFSDYPALSLSLSLLLHPLFRPLSIPRGMAGEDCDYLFKAVLVGDSAVGKSNLLWRIAGGEFRLDSKPTIGVEFAYRDVKVGGNHVKAQLWDTAGQERFRAITSSYYRGALGALLVYDITRRSTFESTAKWLAEMRRCAGGDMVIVLVGNKSDLRHAREVPEEDGRMLAEQENLCFMETSALENSNIEDAFMAMVVRILEVTLQHKALDSETGGGAAAPPDAGRVLLVADEVSATRKQSCCST